MKKVLVLSDNRPGHFNQSLAVVEAIKNLDDVEVIYLNVKINNVSKYVLRMLLNSKVGKGLFRRKFSLALIKMFYKGYTLKERPDIIISAGKDTSLLNAMLALMFGSKNIFIGHPKKLDNDLFTTILTVLDLGFDNQIVLDVAPTREYSGNLEEFIREYELEPLTQYATLLIGGDGSGYKYNEKDIDQLISFVNSTADKIQWLVTTSRRTPQIYENKMEKEMKTGCFIAFNKNPKKVVAGFLELSSIVFVTEESASMVSEAVASRKPVVTLIPQYCKADENYYQILHKFKEENRIKGMHISSLHTTSLSFDRFIPLQRTSVEEISQKLHRIGILDLE